MEIDKNIPLPPARLTDRTKLIRVMEVGDSLLVKKNEVAPIMGGMRRIWGPKSATSRWQDSGMARVWRIK
jgi:hypothetical protein